MYGPSGHTIFVNCEFTIYISEYPSVENSILKYSGGVQTPVFINYDENQLDISGTYSATNTGDYIATFTPKDGYAFADGSESKSVTWGIYYIWEKYNIQSTTNTKYVDNTNTSTSSMGWGASRYYTYTRYSFNSSTGNYSLTGDSVLMGSAVLNNASLVNNGYKYLIVNGEFREFKSANDSFAIYYTHYASPTTVTTYSKGSTYYGQVHSTNASAYPGNNKSGDYWYVKQ